MSKIAAPGKKYCINCGAEIDEKAEICPECGVRQPIGKIDSVRVQNNASNGMAVAALVLGILCLGLTWIPFIGFLFPVLAIVFGILGINKAKTTGVGGGIATAGLVLGIVTISLWVILVSIFATAISFAF